MRIIVEVRMRIHPATEIAAAGGRRNRVSAQFGRRPARAREAAAAVPPGSA